MKHLKKSRRILRIWSQKNEKEFQNLTGEDEMSLTYSTDSFRFPNYFNSYHVLYLFEPCNLTSREASTPLIWGTRYMYVYLQGRKT